MSDRKNRKLPSSWTPWVAAICIAFVLAAVWIWVTVDPLSITARAERLDALQTTFTIWFGLGGLATLVLFARRQWLQERIHEHQQAVAHDARHDAEQKRITEQFVQAIEQLGHEKAPVRLGGLYALDRLGREHPSQRREIIEIWTAYLRRRVVLPPQQLNAVYNNIDFLDPFSESAESDSEAFDEHEVRIAAQGLIISHFKDPRPSEERDETPPPESEEFWDIHEINLGGALLSYVDFSNCWLPLFFGTRATFLGVTDFTNARFASTAVFVGARFKGDAKFTRSSFGGYGQFGGARFEGFATFSESIFKQHANFRDVELDGEMSFGGSHFHSTFEFTGLQYSLESRIDMADVGTTHERSRAQPAILPTGWISQQEDGSRRLVRDPERTDHPVQ
ncbi:pentapeptide repeat-containing protein [Glycomyces tenuis]|uniref:pentapeptide repeat-containing protein n=1 Tax=Glycomyces tenuis TaxID=58116 RepID=UPI00040D8574|nr:pentapeptide repeat-containing protein [Glycomyces tenuis]